MPIFEASAYADILVKKIGVDANIYREIVRVNFGDSVSPHIEDSKSAGERSKPLDPRRVLSISFFRKC